MVSVEFGRVIRKNISRLTWSTVPGNKTIHNIDIMKDLVLQIVILA